ncbi:RTBS polymerase, partial [Pseudoatta argentina]
AHEGTAVIVKATIRHFENSSCKLDFLQAASITVEDSSGPITFAAIYCPPKHTITQEHFNELFDNLGQCFIAGGDYNVKHPWWGSRQTTPTPRGRQLYAAMQENTSILDAVKESTPRVTTKADALDDLLIYVAIGKLDIETTTLEPTVIPSFQELVVFLTKKAGYSKAMTAHVATSVAKSAYFKGDHQMYLCKAFQGLSVVDHVKQVSNLGRAILDNGSFISEKFLSKLGLKCQSHITINGINQQVLRALKIVNLEMSSRFDSFSTDLKCVVLPCVTQNHPVVEIDKTRLKIPSNIRLADPEFNIPREIDLLIGAEKFWELICVGQIKLGRNQPTLQKSVLGWFVAGVVKECGSRALKMSCNLSMEQDLSTALKSFWQINDGLTHKSLTNEERYIEEFFVNTYSRDSDGRFVIKLPLRPVIQADLFSIVVRFRFFRYVLCADIKKMYRQVRVHESQTFLQTILWREDSKVPMQMFELLTITYGTKPAPFLADRCLQQLAQLEKRVRTSAALLCSKSRVAERPIMLNMNQSEWPSGGKELPRGVISVLTVEYSIQDSVIPYYNYSDLSKLLRAIAYVLRFKYKTRRGKCGNRTDCTSTTELNETKTMKQLIEDVTSEAFIEALKRFISRREKVLNLYSDNGQNFQGLITYSELDLQDISRLSSWHLVEQLKQHFWSRWSKKYLALCQVRIKWKFDTHVKIKVGQLVLLKEDEMMPLRWVLARVVNIHPRPNDIIRAKTVRTSKSVCKKPIVKICPLFEEEC